MKEFEKFADVLKGCCDTIISAVRWRVVLVDGGESFGILPADESDPEGLLEKEDSYQAEEAPVEAGFAYSLIDLCLGVANRAGGIPDDQDGRTSMIQGISAAVTGASCSREAAPWRDMAKECFTRAPEFGYDLNDRCLFIDIYPKSPEKVAEERNQAPKV